MVFRQKDMTAYTPSQCRDEKQTGALGFIDEIGKKT